MPKSTLSNPRGVRGAASLCAVAALAYLFVQDLLTIFVSALMGMRVQGASLSDPVGFSVAAQGLLGIVVSAISAKSGWFPVPKFIFDPIDMIGDSAVPMILMAFGMSLHGTKPLQQKGDRPAIFTVAVLKNIIMPIIAFLLAYFVMGFRGSELYACVVLAALPTGQNVYNYAARYNVGLTFARDGILMSTMTSPVFIAIIAALLS